MEPTTFVLTSADIAACPIHSMSVTHYYPDGSCRCSDEPPPLSREDEEIGEAPEEELPSPGDDHVWIKPYTRSDGTKVAGYWRQEFPSDEG